MAKSKNELDIDEFDKLVDEVLTRSISPPCRVSGNEVYRIVSTALVEMGHDCPTRKRVGGSLHRLNHDQIKTKRSRDWFFTKLPSYPSSRD